MADPDMKVHVMILSDEAAASAIILQAQSISALELVIGQKLAHIRTLDEKISTLDATITGFVDAWQKWVESPESMPSTPVLKAVEALEAYAAKIRN